MKRIGSNRLVNKLTATYMVVALLFANFPLSAFAEEGPSVDIVVNGLNSLTLTDSSQTFTYSWSSQNATGCNFTSPSNGSVDISGSGGPIDSTSDQYPKVGQSITFTITCVDQNGNSATDSATVSFEPVPPVVEQPTVDLVVNGLDGPVTINNGDTFTYSWSSQNATGCSFTSPSNGSVDISGSGGPIGPGSDQYPAVGSSKTFTIVCSNAGGSATDSVVVNVVSAPVTPGAVTVDLVANGLDGSITINQGDTFTYSWSSQNATGCNFTSPSNGSVDISGSGGPIAPGSDQYPTAGHPVTFTIVCTNASSSATDSVTVNLAQTPANPQVTVDLVVNGLDGPVTINNGDTFTYSWSSQNATGCSFTSPSNGSVDISGSGGPIGPGSDQYPAVNGSKTFTITCSNGSSSATDSVVVNVVGTTTPPVTPAVSVDIKANGSDGPVVLSNAAPYTYSWNSQNATTCTFVSPTSSSATLNGTSTPINPGHPLYPATGSSITISITCVNQVSTATDSVTISARQDNGNPPTCPVPAITSSLTANAKTGQSFSYTLTASGSTPILNATNLPSGISYSTTTGVISGTFTQTGTFNITLSASNGCGTDTKTLVVTVTSDSNGGGGGDNDDDNNGGGGHHRSRHRGQVKGEELQCLFISDYMRRDFDNDPIQVMRLQAFLIGFEGYNNVTINGVFDQATYDAVSSFQMKYKDDILTPWGHTGPTGYVYILTLKKVNEIFCQRVFPLNESQIQEIAAFRALLEGLKAQGYDVSGYQDYINKPAPSKAPTVGTTSTTSIPEIPIVGKGIDKGQNLKNIAGAIFTLPNSLMDGLQCLYEFLLILIVLYVLSNVLEDVWSKKGGVAADKRFRNKWIAVISGLVIATLLAYIFGEWCLILPLLISIILSLIWVALRPNHKSIKASIKSWYLVLMGRSKTIINNAKKSAKGSVAEKKETAESKEETVLPKEEVKKDEPASEVVTTKEVMTVETPKAEQKKEESK